MDFSPAGSARACTTPGWHSASPSSRFCAPPRCAPSPAVLIVPLEQAFGWSPATIAAAISLNLVLYGLIGPFAAALMQRIGMRRTLMGALAVVLAGVRSARS